MDDNLNIIKSIADDLKKMVKIADINECLSGRCSSFPHVASFISTAKQLFEKVDKLQDLDKSPCLSFNCYARVNDVHRKIEIIGNSLKDLVKEGGKQKSEEARDEKIVEVCNMMTNIIDDVKLNLREII